MQEKEIIEYKIATMEVDKTQEIVVEEDGEVTIKGVMFAKNTITKITLTKRLSEKNEEEVFIKFYCGNIMFAVVIFEKDFKVEKMKDFLSTQYFIR